MFLRSCIFLLCFVGGLVPVANAGDHDLAPRFSRLHKIEGLFPPSTGWLCQNSFYKVSDEIIYQWLFVDKTSEFTHTKVMSEGVTFKKTLSLCTFLIFVLKYYEESQVFSPAQGDSEFVNRSEHTFSDAASVRKDEMDLEKMAAFFEFLGVSYLAKPWVDNVTLQQTSFCFCRV